MIYPLKFWVRKHPTTDTLCTALASIPDGEDVANWEHLTEAELEAWKVAEIANGWTPVVIQAVAPVPESVSPRQIRRALNAAGLRSSVEVAIAAAAQDVKDDWEFALEVRRDWPALNAMAASLGMTSQQVDELFISANGF